MGDGGAAAAAGDDQRERVAAGPPGPVDDLLYDAAEIGRALVGAGLAGGPRDRPGRRCAGARTLRLVVVKLAALSAAHALIVSVVAAEWLSSTVNCT